MEAQSNQHSQVIEISGDVSGVRRNPRGSKNCGEAPCGFSDAGSISKDSEERSTSMLKLLMAVVLCVIFMSIEVVGGIKANSLAILTDAAHLLSDVAAFAISLFSLWAAGWEANPRQSYGFFRVEILGALFSIQLIWLLAGILVYEAIERIVNGTRQVNGCLMFIIAAFGLVVSITMALLLGHDHGHGHGRHGHSYGLPGSDHHHVHNHHDAQHPKDSHHHTHEDDTQHQDCRHHDENNLEDEHDHAHEDHMHHHANEEVVKPLLGKSKGRYEKKRRWNINVRAAYLHALGDSVQSVGVMIGGAIIWCKPDWQIVDLICSLIFSLVVLGTTINMLRNILEVLMESTPREIDAAKLQRGLLDMEEVVAVHEFHIWAITVGKVLLACHVKIRPEVNADMVLDKVINYIRRVYNISHVTIQIER